MTVGIGKILWMASNTSNPLIFLSSGAFAYFTIYFLCSKFIQKHISSEQKHLFLLMKYLIGVMLFIIVSSSLLLPLSESRKEFVYVEGQKVWELDSGSKIAYVQLSGDLNESFSPIIFLHGGPGVPDMYGDANYFKQLTQDGYDVYIYDQVGSGRSSRLKDPEGYTIERDVEDLDLIRQKIGADKVILIGHSYGAEIVAHYLVGHEEHVEKAIFTSPGALNPHDKSGANLTSRLLKSEKMSLYKALLQPRVLMVYSLLQINPTAAINFAGDAEMDNRFDIVYGLTVPALHARSVTFEGALSGLGFYANQMPQSISAVPKPDIRNELRNSRTPALILKASSDYLSWESAMDYKSALKQSSLIYLTGAGHNIYQDKPELVLKIIRAFLNDEPLPIEPYTQLIAPKDFEGKQ